MALAPSPVHTPSPGPTHSESESARSDSESLARASRSRRPSPPAGETGHYQRGSLTSSTKGGPTIDCACHNVLGIGECCYTSGSWDCWSKLNTECLHNLQTFPDGMLDAVGCAGGRCFGGELCLFRASNAEEGR